MTTKKFHGSYIVKAQTNRGCVEESFCGRVIGRVLQAHYTIIIIIILIITMILLNDTGRLE